jgi:peptidoglycan DL-endopeptidase CwlO
MELRRLTRAVLVFVLASSALACGSRRAVPRPFPAPGSAATPADALPAATSGAVTALLATATALSGVPYRNGGSDPGGFDCSGFVQFVFAQHGVVLRRATWSSLRSAGLARPTWALPSDRIASSTRPARGASCGWSA